MAMHHVTTATPLTFVPLATAFPSPALGLPALDPCQIPTHLWDLVQVLLPLGHLFWSSLSQSRIMSPSPGLSVSLVNIAAPPDRGAAGRLGSHPFSCGAEQNLGAGGP